MFHPRPGFLEVASGWSHEKPKPGAPLWEPAWKQAVPGESDCEHSRPALVVHGTGIGQTIEACTTESCKVHRPVRGGLGHANVLASIKNCWPDSAKASILPDG